MNRSFIFLILFVLIFIGVTSSIFVVDEREKALVLQFGQVKSVKTDPGIKFKIPLIQNVVRYDDRILSLDTMPLEVTPLDGRRLVVDAFARYRIVNVVMFRKAVGTGGTASAEVRLERILNAALREVLGSVTSNKVTSADRVELMTRIRDAAITEAGGLGVEIVDVRIKRADLPQANLAATFQRMQAERERMAADERARGREAAQRVRALANRKAMEIVSEARRDAEIIRGQADAETTRLLAEAFGRDPEFYAFIRSLKAYEGSMTGKNTTIVLSPDSEFFDYIKESGSK
jgi:membrane protease subunit HflC